VKETRVNLASILTATAERHPDRPALELDEREIEAPVEVSQ
jgi:hypothetical protein